MKKILLLIIATLFLSCNQQEVKPFEDYEYNVELYKVDLPDNQELYQVKCFKRKYRVWLDVVGAKEKFFEAPVKECEKLFGWKPLAKANLWALMEYARKEANECLEQRSLSGEVEEPVLPGAIER
jgi:hypothetical protein